MKKKFDWTLLLLLTWLFPVILLLKDGEDCTGECGIANAYAFVFLACPLALVCTGIFFAIKPKRKK